MKVFHLDEAAVWGGAENQLELLHAGLVGRGHDSTVLCRPGSPLGRRLRSVAGAVRPYRPRIEMDVVAAIRLARMVRKEEPDIVHAHTSRSHAIARLAQLVFPDFRLVVSRRVNYPVRRNGFSRLKYRFGVARYLAVCEAVKRTLIEGGVDAARVSVVYSCARNAGRPAAPPPSGGRFVVGFAARLEANKRPVDALEAVDRLRKEGLEVSLQIAGEGRLRSELERLIVEKRLNGVVTLLGHQPDLGTFYSRIHALVFCSEGGEGLPNVVLEAMAAGVPVVASRVDGIPEILQDGDSGILVSKGDVAALASGLGQIVKNPEQALQRAARARGRAEADFRPEIMVERTVGVYQDVVKSPI